jgi:hypothetical protein
VDLKKSFSDEEVKDPNQRRRRMFHGGWVEAGVELDRKKGRDKVGT